MIDGFATYIAGLDNLINSRMYKDEAGDWVCGFCGKTAGPKTNIRNHIGKDLIHHRAG
jgi:hypothetical protein